MTAKNMNQLRETVLKAIEDLENGDIEINKAFCIAKLSETVVSGLRSEMQYAILTKKQLKIQFYEENNGKIIEGETVSKLSEELMSIK